MKKDPTIFSNSPSDTIYRTETGLRTDWWNTARRPSTSRWRLLKWSLMLLAVFLVLGVVIYFLLIDMQTLAENDRPAKNHQKGDGFWLEDDPNRIDKVVSLDGDVLLDLGGVAYHREPSNKPQDNIQKDTNNNNNEDKFDSMQDLDMSISPENRSRDFIEILPAPDSSAVKRGHDSGIEFAATNSPLSASTIGRRTTLYRNYKPVQPTLPSNSHKEPAPVYENVNEKTSMASLDFGQNLTDSEMACFSPRLAMCRGVLPYDLTTLPRADLVPGASTASQLEQAMPYFEMVLESGCSARARQFLCSLLEPACQPPGKGVIPPCRKACKAVAEECSDFILATLDLSRIFKCDHYPDSEDQEECVNFAREDKCMEKEFRCPEGSCIPNRWRCDNARDCAGGEDELNCTRCAPDQFRCQSDAQCLPSRWHCDGQKDCRDGSDEVGCAAQRRGGCGHGQFRCADRSACIPASWICDGSTQCRDGSDERNCSFHECRPESVKCHNSGICIPTLKLCNGVSDCPDNSDEEFCKSIKQPPVLTSSPHTSPCPSGELRCVEGRCIVLSQLCDGVRDCSDGADEANCGSQTNMPAVLVT